MKKNLLHNPTKDYPIVQFYLDKIRLILISILIISCHPQEKKEDVSKTKFHWQPGISAPKYYPVAGNIDFGNAGNGSNTSFDNGWGQGYGSVSSGEEYKDIPKFVNISYFSVVDDKKYEGTVKLDQKKAIELFEKYSKSTDHAYLIVGMAPGGWIRVWYTTTIGSPNDDDSRTVQMEIAKAKLKGHYDETVGTGLKTKDFKTWGSTYTYWQHHGIPYEAWANNEKEYDMYFDFYRQKSNGFAYVSADGTHYQGGGVKLHQKLPVQFEQIAWLDKYGNPYNCKVPMPKNFKKYIEEKRLKEVKLQLEIENDDEHAIIYLITNTAKEKIVRFKNKKPTVQEKKDIDFAYATEIEYFIK